MTLATEFGTTMADMDYVSTSAVNLTPHVYGEEGKVIHAVQATKAASIIPKSIFVPRGNLVVDMPEGPLLAKASTKTGLLLMSKPAVQLTATLLLLASTVKGKTIPFRGQAAPTHYWQQLQRQRHFVCRLEQEEKRQHIFQPQREHWLWRKAKQHCAPSFYQQGV